jgi:hypothetical protein
MGDDRRIQAFSPARKRRPSARRTRIIDPAAMAANVDDRLIVK